MPTDSPSLIPLPWVTCSAEVLGMSLGEKIKELRKEKGWSQDEFAASAQIDGRQVSRYENDRVVPSVDVVVKIAKAFNVSADFLLFDDIPRRELQTRSSKLVERVLQLENISEDDERSLLHLLDAIEAKNKLKALAANVG